MSSKALNDSDISDYTELPSHEEVIRSPQAFMEMTKLIERESNPWSGTTLVQKADSRTIVVYPPQRPLSTAEMDRIYDLPFSRKPHPVYRGEIPAFRMIRNSITVVRGCAGGCSFCALGLHQGRTISSRSIESVLREVSKLKLEKYFRGTVTDLGGPTANLYGMGCTDTKAEKACKRNSCLYPGICEHFRTDHDQYLNLLDSVSRVKGVSNVFVSSGIRFDVALRDIRFIERLTAYHVSGLLKIAPEHFSREVLKLMRKPGPDLFRDFKDLFEKYSKKAGKKQYIEPYILVAFPGCGMNQMHVTVSELNRQNMRPEKSQIFLPTPMTMATAMYFTELHPDTGESIYVARKPSSKKRQLSCLPGHTG